MGPAVTRPDPPDGRPAREIGLWFTNECNLRCSYCYIRHKSSQTIRLDAAMGILERELSQEGEPADILCMGAEALTHFEQLRALVEAVRARDWPRRWHFTITTNGTLLTPQMKRWFADHRDEVCLCLSYDGSDADQDRNRCGSSGRSDQDFFLRNWPHQPWKVTISRQTAAHIDRGLIELHEKGMRFTANAAYEPDAWSEEQIVRYELALYRLGDYYAAHPAVEPCNLLASLPEPLPRPEEVRQERACGAGQSLCFYDMDSRVYPCHMLSTLVTDADRTVQGRYFVTDADFEDPRCRGCALKCDCYTCLGTNHLYRGDMRMRDPLHCRLYQAEVRAAMHMWIGMLAGRDAYTAREREVVRRLQALSAAFAAGAVGMRI